uniref:PPM-type phosphatase domain-containing protein n=1 Tax=Meloidogyne enterolobii TaxID=390850 RepID=A0A6V7WPU8_MELEN|nr:unnamed protein product [Meloidogyne enterolobii]
MSSFFRRHVRGLLRTTFSAPQSTETISSIATNNADDDFDNHDESEEERLLLSLDHRLGPAGTSSENNFQTRNGKKRQSAPEVYSGKTGLDLPNIHIGPLSMPIKACHTGPEGGLTCVQPMRQRTIAKMAKLDDEEFSLSSMDEEVDEREEEEEVEVREEEENEEVREEENEEVKERDEEREEEKEEEDEEENEGKEVGEEVKEGRGENGEERFEEENEEEKKGTEVKNEVIEEMNGFRPVDEDQEDLSGRYQQQTQLIKPTKETKFLEVPKKENKKIKKTTRKSRGGGKALIQSADSIEALGLVGVDDFSPFRNGSALEQLDWSSWDEHRALGLSTSLYERHPVSGLPAGHPIADVFGIIARENNAILALADGVNWGDGARLAARCAIRGAIDHLNNAIERQQLNTTNEIFHSMLGAFHAAHALILQEGGALTTLCVAFVAPVKDSDSSVLCVCNVGDSLCFVYNQTHGVNEITLGSHNIAQMRDMRDAGGALGPVDGRNPQLHNLTCSMTFVEKGDLPRDEAEEEVTETITSEKENNLTTNQQQQRNNTSSTLLPPPFHKTKSAPASNIENVRKPINGTHQHLSLQNKPPLQNTNNNINNLIPSPLREMKRRQPAATLPFVDAPQRHELMLLRMNDIISNGLCIPHEHQQNSPQERRQISAVELCNNLVQFAYKLSSAKRHTLEDPELYRTRTHSRTEERLRRKMIRNMIMEMPGKLDHASVVAYQVGSEWPATNERENNERTIFEESPINNLKIEDLEIKEENREENVFNNAINPNKQSVAVQCSWRPPTAAFSRSSKHPQQHTQTQQTLNTNTTTQTKTFNTINISNNIINNQQKHQTNIKEKRCLADLSPSKIVPVKTFEEKDVLIGLKTKKNVEKNREINTNKSPYEELPRFGEGDEEENSQSENYENKQILNGDKGRKSKRRHGRGSLARHTLGVDVSWLKRLVTNKHGISAEENNSNKHENNKEEENKEEKNKQEKNIKHENNKQNNTPENNLNNNNKHLNNIRTQQQHKHSPPTLNRNNNKHEEGETTRFSSTSSSSSTNSQKHQKHNPRLDSFDLINKNLKKRNINNFFFT